MKRPVAACGTPSGMVRHRRNKEKPCEACYQAENDYNRVKYLVVKSGWTISAGEAYAELGLPRDRIAMAVGAGESAATRPS